MLPRNNADVTHCEKNSVYYFQNKAVYRAEDRPSDISSKIDFYMVRVKFLILVSSDVK